MSEYQLSSNSEAETEMLGATLGALLFPGAFIALYGDLGAGKTALARGIGKALGIPEINSPTFNIVHEYASRIPLYHFDAYRLRNDAELHEMGFEEYLGNNGILLMEWPAHVADALPEQRLDISIEGSGNEERVITFIPKGSAYCRLVDQLTACEKGWGH